MNDYRQTRLKDNLALRAEIIRAIRRFFFENGYLEIETPVLTPAPAPEPHIDAEPCGDRFLQTSPELYMKRLLAAGYTKLFQLCKCFRKNERGRRHLPEFTLLEWYTAGDDYTAMMTQTEALILSVCRAVYGRDHLDYMGRRIDLTPPWERLPVRDAFGRFAGVSPETALEQGRFDELMVDAIEPNLNLGKPVFLYDYPAAAGALARLKPDDTTVAERFEIYMGGLELCNGFTELIDPEEQRLRFAEAQKELRLSGKSVYPMPERFLEALKDMPEASGNAMGLDRLVMLFADAASIDEVVAFTTEES